MRLPEIGYAIRRARVARGMTQAKLAATQSRTPPISARRNRDSRAKRLAML